MPGKIFVNCRRGDDAGFTQALYQRLEDEFPSDDLFMDVEGHIKPGDDFVEVLTAQAAKSDVVLAVIGSRWADLLAQRAGDKDHWNAVVATTVVGRTEAQRPHRPLERNRGASGT